MTTASVRPKAWTALTRALKAGLITVGLMGGSVGAYWGALQYQGNFHTVEEGAFYRSAQLDKNELRQAVRDHQIKAILNLRGAHPGQPWYDDEVAVSKALGVSHYDYGLSAHRLVTDGQIGDLLGIIRNAPKPLLVHCKSGADRTGLVSALYRFAIEGKSKAEADAQLTLIYGHFPYLTSGTRAMDDSFWAFVGRRAGLDVAKYVSAAVQNSDNRTGGSLTARGLRPRLSYEDAFHAAGEDLSSREGSYLTAGAMHGLVNAGAASPLSN